MNVYTPGPWHYATKGPGLLGIYAGDARFARASDLIAGIASADNQVANALIIAAAPDLLVTLENLLDTHADVIGSGTYAEARAAIRNARGE